MIDTLTARARRRGWLRAKVVGFALDRARKVIGLRELPKFYMVVALAAVRRQLAVVGSELAAMGRIEGADDVFFLDLPEARAGLSGLDLRKVVAERRAAYDLELRRRHVPRVLLSDGTEPESVMATAAPKDGAMLGTPASPGRVRTVIVIWPR